MRMIKVYNQQIGVPYVGDLEDALNELKIMYDEGKLDYQITFTIMDVPDESEQP